MTLPAPALRRAASEGPGERVQPAGGCPEAPGAGRVGAARVSPMSCRLVAWPGAVVLAPGLLAGEGLVPCAAGGPSRLQEEKLFPQRRGAGSGAAGAQRDGNARGPWGRGRGGGPARAPHCGRRGPPPSDVQLSPPPALPGRESGTRGDRRGLRGPRATPQARVAARAGSPGTGRGWRSRPEKGELRGWL